MEKLSRYYEMPMAIRVRIVMAVMTVVARAVVVPVTITVFIVVVVMIRGANFDMDMGNVVLRMAVPQGEPKPRRGSRVQQQSVCMMESAECSLPAKGLLPERFHLRLPNDRQANVEDVTDSPESPTIPGSENAMAGATDIRTVYG
jgi:hypothetical protein